MAAAAIAFMPYPSAQDSSAREPDASGIASSTPARLWEVPADKSAFLAVGAVHIFPLREHRSPKEKGYSIKLIQSSKSRAHRSVHARQAGVYKEKQQKHTLSAADSSSVSGGGAAQDDNQSNGGNSSELQCFANNGANSSVTVCQSGKIQTAIVCVTNHADWWGDWTDKTDGNAGGGSGSSTTCSLTTTDIGTGKIIETIKVGSIDSDDGREKPEGTDDGSSGDGGTQ